MSQSTHIWDLGKICGPLYFYFFFLSGNEITARSALNLQCDFKNHFHIHYLSRSSELWKVNNELTFTLTYLFEESIQLNTCTWEKQVGTLPNTFWQLLSLSFSFEPTASLEGSRGAVYQPSRPRRPWTVARTCLLQTAVSNWITDCVFLERKAILSALPSPRVRGWEGDWRGRDFH